MTDAERADAVRRILEASERNMWLGLAVLTLLFIVAALTAAALWVELSKRRAQVEGNRIALENLELARVYVERSATLNEKTEKTAAATKEAVEQVKAVVAEKASDL